MFQGFGFHRSQLPLPGIALDANKPHVVKVAIRDCVVESRCAVPRIIELRHQLPEPYYRIPVLGPHFDNGLRKIKG